MLKRYMQDVTVEPIYHKRAAKNTPFETVQIRFPSQRPGRMNVPVSEADVIRLVQLGCLDFHPWPVRSDDIDHPDELRFDFDPTEGFDFGHVRQAAAGAKDLLDELGLVGWPKTSGSRGIHIYVRIEPIWDYFQTRRAVLAFARELERRMDGLVTTSWWKEERQGVFVDYNQNARDKTVSSAYGVRPTGFVSTPFEWDELADIEISDFPLGSFAERWDSVGDLTEGIDESAGRIDTLMEWVLRDEENGIGDAPWPPHQPELVEEVLGAGCRLANVAEVESLRGVEVESELIGMIDVVRAHRPGMKVETAQLYEANDICLAYRDIHAARSLRWEADLHRLEGCVLGCALVIDGLDGDVLHVALQHRGTAGDPSGGPCRDLDEVVHHVAFGPALVGEHHSVR
jgi:DNA ligase D-like protein (predicted polymerase)